MFLILGIVAIIVFTIQVYKTASGTERNAPFWAAVTAVTGVAFQFVFPVILGVLIVVYYVATGTEIQEVESAAYGPALVINLVCFVVSIVGMWLVMKHVSNVKDDLPAAKAPPPPPTFTGGR